MNKELEQYWMKFFNHPLCTEELIDIVRERTGIDTNIKVNASRHTILSGAPGVGKTFTTIQELEKHNIPYVLIEPGMSDIVITMKLAWGVYNLEEDQELVVVPDDADDVIFKDLKTLNKWKLATGKHDPHWGYNSSIMGTVSQLRKQKKNAEAQALLAFQEEGEIGLKIPLDRVRFFVLCNKDYEDPAATSAKFFDSIEPVLDRFEYIRLDMPWQEKWGWLAHVLCSSQPFDDYSLDDEDKKELLDFLYNKWENIKSRYGASYRFVEKLAADSINHPTTKIDKWNRRIK